ncbi:NAD-dependent dehydratase [Microvirga makkahensis]|uniref:NAD-dependent dehydratase n=1 Tax=Microvirga makkahensis TaxID=1128670 RepID=A0A7X3MNZ2_9HYPH|nr:NAD-dependent dehydratase [Microvirga makkahensis]MXQ10500.1 NAD-dependent dehydratase [Microvirga makkahensis]
MTTLMLVGATGLVGGAVLRQALADARVTRIVAPTRRELPPHPKLKNPLVDFEHLPADAAWWAVDGVICTLGTTIRKAGSQETFRRVDHDHSLALARLARQHGARAFALNSATGADPRSRFFYNRVKGEVEEAIRGVGFPSLTLVRPALIGGERGEFRPAEFMVMPLLRLVERLLPRRYRVVPHQRLATALLEAAITAPPGERIIESEAIV